jgi:hypothetical protein
VNGGDPQVEPGNWGKLKRDSGGQGDYNNGRVPERRKPHSGCRAVPLSPCLLSICAYNS